MSLIMFRFVGIVETDVSSVRDCFLSYVGLLHVRQAKGMHGIFDFALRGRPVLLGFDQKFLTGAVV